MSHHKCCCGPPPDCTLTVTVTGCSSRPVKGVTVTLKLGGTTVDSGTTDSGGHITLSAPCGATYDLTANAGARLTTYSGTWSPVSGAYTQTIGLSAVTGYHCCAGCGPPWPVSLFLSLPTAGTLTANYPDTVITSSGSTIGWAVSYTYTGVSCYDCTTDCGTIGPGTGNVTVHYGILCPESVGTPWKLAVWATVVRIGGVNYYLSDTCVAHCSGIFSTVAATGTALVDFDEGCDAPLATTTTLPTALAFGVNSISFTPIESGTTAASE